MTKDLTTIEPPMRDGFDDELDQQKASSIIQGTLLKFKDGHWFESGTPFPGACLVAIDCKTVLQRWENQRPVKTVVEFPLPSIDDLNSQVPEDEWELGLDGEPRPPWVKNYIVYLFNFATAEEFTAVGATAGMAIAYRQLAKSVRLMRKLRGDRVFPVVKLGTAPMQTRFGLKARPNFEIVEWRQFGASAAEPPPRIGAPVAQPTAAELIDDEIPF